MSQTPLQLSYGERAEMRCKDPQVVDFVFVSLII